MKIINASARLLKYSSAFALAAGTCQAAFAQNAEQTEGSGNDIVVTAQRVEQKINDIGMSIQAFGGEALVKNDITSPEQLTKLVTGLNVTTGGIGLPVYTLRGVGFYDLVAGTSPAVSLYLDETPVPYPIMSRGLAMDISRVEVLKGPQGTLYGQNATAGAINFIANRPTDHLSAGASLSYSSYDRVTIDAFVSGPVSDTLNVRFAGRADNGGDWQRSATRDATRGAKRFYAGRFLADWDPGDNIRFRLNVNGWVDKSDEVAPQFIALATLPSRITPALRAAIAPYSLPTSARQADWDANLTRGHIDPVSGETFDGYNRDDNYLQIGLRSEFDLSDKITLTSITSWNHLKQATFFDADGTSSVIYNEPSKAKITSFSQEIRLGGSTTGLTWQVGTSYNRDVIDNFGTAYNDIGTQPFRSAGTVGYFRTRTLAAFAHVDLKLTENLSAVAGIRYTNVHLRNTGCTVDTGDGTLAPVIELLARSVLGSTVSVAPGACGTLNLTTGQPGWVKSKLNEENVPFNIGLNYKLDGDSLLYASVRRGYKAGSYSPNGAVFESSLDPAIQESVLAYEVGAKVGALDNRLNINTALFYYDYKNKQVRGKIIDPLLGAVGKLINVPESTVKGAELQLGFTPNKNWAFNAGVTYVDAKVSAKFVNYKFSGAGPVNLDGSTLPLTPSWQGQADIEYNGPVSAGVDVYVGGHMQYQGKANSGLGEEALFRTNAYTKFDLRAGVRANDGNWSVGVFVNNVTNKYSWSAVFLNGPDAVVRMADLPRIVGLRASWAY